MKKEAIEKYSYYDLWIGGCNLMIRDKKELDKLYEIVETLMIKGLPFRIVNCKQNKKYTIFGKNDLEFELIEDENLKEEVKEIYSKCVKLDDIQIERINLVDYR